MAWGRGSACLAPAGEEGGGAGTAGGADGAAREGDRHAAASGGEAVTAPPPWPTVAVSNPATEGDLPCLSPSSPEKG